MKCCREELCNPDIIDGTAYFVCAKCGNVQEIQNYRVYTTDEAVRYFAEQTGYQLPHGYVNYIEPTQGKIIALPECENEISAFYFGEGFYVMAKLASIDPNHQNSIYNAISIARDWGVLPGLVPLEGDGHTWLALDYRHSNDEPKVVVIETDEGNILTVANSFNEFILKLRPYADVYDFDGNLICRH